MYLKEVLFILELKKITLADRPLFESYLSRSDQRGSECAFTNLFVWQDCYGIYWTVVHDFLVIKVKRNEVDFFLQPFGGKDEDLPKLFAEIKEYHEGKPFEIHGIYDDGKERLAKAFPEMEFIEDRDNWDYVYLREKLASLSGRKYHGKKNHYNAFKKEYPDYVYEPIGPDNYEECKAFGDEWCEKRVGEDESLRCEQCAIHEAIDNFEALGLRGGAIRVNGKIEAFSFGKKINDDTAVLHVEKANPDIRGIYAAINKEPASIQSRAFLLLPMFRRKHTSCSENNQSQKSLCPDPYGTDWAEYSRKKMLPLPLPFSKNLQHHPGFRPDYPGRDSTSVLCS